jgi:hypothetical protein
MNQIYIILGYNSGCPKKNMPSHKHPSSSNMFRINKIYMLYILYINEIWNIKYVLKNFEVKNIFLIWNHKLLLIMLYGSSNEIIYIL